MKDISVLFLFEEFFEEKSVCEARVFGSLIQFYCWELQAGRGQQNNLTIRVPRDEASNCVS